MGLIDGLSKRKLKMSKMNIEKIKQIISSGENVTTEFKECLDRVSNSVYETICSFLNHKGGILFLGVKDDGEIVGINSSSVNQLVKTLINASNNPELFIPYANVSPEVVDIEGKTIIVLEILPSNTVYQYKHKFYDRNGDADVDVTRQPELLNLLFERKSTNLYEGRIAAGVTMTDLDSGTFDICRKFNQREDGSFPWSELSNEDILQSCQLVRQGKNDVMVFTNAALLLFGKEDSIMRFMPRYRIEGIFRSYTFEDYEKGLDSDVRYDDRLTLHCNLVEAYLKLLKFIQRNLPDKFYIGADSFTRQDLRMLLFREIAANMCVHADYASGFASFFEIYTDRVVTRNRTRLVQTSRDGVIGIEQLGNYTKNPLLVKLFRELGWVEDLGSGTRKIKKYAPLYYKNYEIEIQDEEDFVFSITYSKGNGSQKLESDIVAPMRRGFPSFQHEMVYVYMRYYPKAKIEEIAKAIKIGVRTTYRLVSDLREQGFVENVGVQKEPQWVLKNG